MSKKKGKTPPKKASKKASNKPVRRAASAGTARTASRQGTKDLTGRGYTSQITIFLFRTPNGNRIRTAPQRAYAGPGQIEWTVVNMIDGSDVPVRLTWVGESPFKPSEFRNRFTDRIPYGVKKGVYKYVVHAFDTKEDPEVEIPWN